MTCDLFVVFVSIFISLFLAFLALIFYLTPKQQRFSVGGKHAFVTGGSKGIGRELAAELLCRGAKTVTIVARNINSLLEAKQGLERFCQPGQTVECFTLDVIAGYKEIEAVVLKAEQRSGPIDLLINNVGFVVQGRFDEISPESFESQMRINYIGGAHLARAVVDQMKSRRCGHICFVSSAAGQCAIWGYSAYSPSKFAVRGFADALHMELLPYGIGVSIVYPPNTDTEGFAVEQKDMPEEVRAITGAARLFTAKQVAQETIKTIEAGGFAITIGLEGWILRCLTAGASPEPNALAAVCQCLLAGLFRGVMLVYLNQFNLIVQKFHEKSRKS